MTPFLTIPAPSREQPSATLRQENETERPLALAAALTNIQNRDATLNAVLCQFPVTVVVNKYLSPRDIINLRNATSTDSAVHDNLSWWLRSHHPTQEFEHRKCSEAIDYLSSRERTQDANPLRNASPDEQHLINEKLQTFQEKMSPHLAVDHLPTSSSRDEHPEQPDFVSEDAQVFFSRLLKKDQETQQEGRKHTHICHFFLSRAFSEKNWAAAFKMLEGAQLEQEKSRSTLPLTGFLDGDKTSLLHNKSFWEEASPEWLKMLLAPGVLDVNQRSSPLGVTPLTEACRTAPNADAVKLLLDAGADPNLGGACGFGPLHACLGPDVPARMSKLDALLSHPAIDVTKTAAGTSPLHIAISSGLSCAVEKIVQHPAASLDRFLSRTQGSALTYAARLFLSDKDYPARVLYTLAAAGGRLELSPQRRQNRNDDAHDIALFLQAARRQNFPEDRIDTLADVLCDGRIDEVLASNPWPCSIL